MRCPYCASENIYFSKKRKMYFCEDCDAGFDTPSVSSGTRVFISYGHDKNAAIVAEIKEYLRAHGYDVWIDTSEIPYGADWRERITNGIIGSNDILSFLSKHSVRDPGVCLDELRIAVCLKHAYLKTVLLENENDVKPPRFVANIQWIDLSHWENIPEKEWSDFFETKMQDILTILKSDDAVNYNAEIERLSDRLSVFDHNTKAEHLLKQVYIGRTWLANDVQNWLCTAQSRTMMIYGVPGSGKSAFAANLAQYNPQLIGSVFFEWNNTMLSDVDYVTKLFALKLAVRLPDYRKMLCNLLRDEAAAKRLLQNHHGSSLFDLLVLNPLQCCIDGDREICAFVLDGLDETSPQVAALLLNKARQLPAWLKIIFTSRGEETEHSYADLDHIVYLDHSSADNEKDIEDYIAFRLQTEHAWAKKLAEKSEGSFMYAQTLCDAISKGQLSLMDADSLPAGINQFYLDYFNRLFTDYDHYGKIRAFLELLCVEDELPEEMIRRCLQLDQYELWEIRCTLKSLIRTVTIRNDHVIRKFAMVNGVPTAEKIPPYKSFKFVHKSIKEWLTTIELSGKYYVDAAKGYRALIDLSSGVGMHGKVKFDNSEADRIYSSCYPKWLIKAGCCDMYRDLLLNSFDADECRKKYESDWRGAYSYYHSLHSLWRYADMLPMNYPVEEIRKKFEELVIFPAKFMVSNFAHRSLQIIALILKDCMVTGRFAPVFFTYMRLNYDGYFRSCSSDDLGETRDGWDKYYMTRDAVICLKRCDALGIDVPSEVRQRCERMKLSYNYYWGENDGMFAGGDAGCWKYGILSENELFKDVCILDEQQDMSAFAHIKEEQSRYNTLSLMYYLAHSDEEDVSFVRLCIKHGAKLDEACEQAVREMEREAQKNFKQTRFGTILRRTAFISSLESRLL